ncbi:unnamed protein product [Caenorhabditis sp. 36 PRJEB53466]|nr:unnamed protein product [Caenorhabditis sp. 36 PRJEB53466]
MNAGQNPENRQLTIQGLLPLRVNSATVPLPMLNGHRIIIHFFPPVLVRTEPPPAPPPRPPVSVIVPNPQYRPELASEREDEREDEIIDVIND